MASVSVEGFGGIAPIFDPRKLPQSAATLALDCKFYGHDIVPLMAHSLLTAWGFAPSKLYKYQYQGASRWLAWPSPRVVNICASPIPQDPLGRLYWSEDGGVPRVISQPAASDIGPSYSGNVRQLGVPQPATTPRITETKKNMSVVPSAVSATAPVTVTANAQPFENGWTVIVQAAASTDGGLKEIVGMQFVIGNCTANTFDLLTSDGSSYTKWTPASNITIARVYQNTDIETRSYVFTQVTDFGEEGPPSNPSTPQDFLYDSTEAVTCPLDTPSWAVTQVNRIRLYRSVAGNSGANFFFVKEHALTVSEISSRTVTIVDDVLPASIGELLPSTTWTPPPTGLKGMVALPNGFFAGFIGNTIYFSEQYMPHAWPAEYTKTTQWPIVGLAVYGQTLVVTTLGKPSLAVGSDPLSMTMAELDLNAPCINRFAMASTGTGVMWPTPDGLAFVSASAQELITVPYISAEQWQTTIFGTGMQAIFYNTRYIAFSGSAARKTLIIENRPDSGMNISFASVMGLAPAVDPDTDQLTFVNVPTSGPATQQYAWEGGTTSLTGVWQSKVFAAAHAVNPSIGRVYASKYPVTLTVAYANFTNPFSLTDPTSGQTSAEIVQSFDIFVLGSEPFRLPATYMSREFQLKVQATGRVQSVSISDNFDELR